MRHWLQDLLRLKELFLLRLFFIQQYNSFLKIARSFLTQVDTLVHIILFFFAQQSPIHSWYDTLSSGLDQAWDRDLLLHWFLLVLCERYYKCTTLYLPPHLDISSLLARALLVLAHCFSSRHSLYKQVITEYFHRKKSNIEGINKCITLDVSFVEEPNMNIS